MDYTQQDSRFYQKDISGCAILGILNQNGECFDADAIIRGISCMHDRSNGLGGGFGAYGCYPEYKDFYAFHIMYLNAQAAERTQAYLEENFQIEHWEVIPHDHSAKVQNHPLIRRYFVKPKMVRETEPDRIYENISEDEFVVRSVFKINTEFQGAFVFSSGKNMGIFKGVGYPEEVAKFYKLRDYHAYCWTAHGRFPTNSQAWWGGAHPFGLLDISVIHNGEISSYGINKRYLENAGYKCVLGTDTEVIAYLWDLFLRKQGLNFETGSKILAAPFWSEIDRMPEEKRTYYTKLRMIYASALLNGPFAIVVGFNGGMAALNDRLKLRPLVGAKTNGFLYVGSEESAIREAANFKTLDQVWTPFGGEMIFGRVKSG